MSRNWSCQHLSILTLIAFATLSSGGGQTSRGGRTSTIQEFSHPPNFDTRPNQFSHQYAQAAGHYSRDPSSSIILPANNQIQAATIGREPHLPNKQSIGGSGGGGGGGDKQKHHSLPSSTNGDTTANLGRSSGQHEPLQRVDDEKLTTSINIDHQKRQNDGSSRNLIQGSIEMALRQTSGDESYFQAPSALDWLAIRQDSATAAQTSGSSSTKQHQQLLTTPHMVATSDAGLTTQAPSSSIVQPTTTEESNLILDGSSASSSADMSYDLADSIQRLQQQQQSTTNLLSSEEQQHLAVSTGQPPTQPALNGSQQSSSVTTAGPFELSNNVVYEGPATVPPAGDFYFPHSDRLPGGGANAGDYRAPNVWWNIGVGQEFERASNLTRDDYIEYCSKSEKLVSDKQRSLCKLHPEIMAAVARGLRMAFDECQLRFSNGRWNCSMVLAESMEQNHLSARLQPFGEVMQKPNRERSFLNAIISAGIAHAMTKACSQGDLPEECSCDKRIKSKGNKGKIEWVACSDDIDYGARFSRDFTDQMEGDTDTASMINSHNYEVGRRIFKSATDITCNCQNGDNGLCQTKKCWKHLSPFSEIGDELIKRYESATHVQVSSKDPRKLRPVRRGVRKPKRKDLVFIEESPDYCEENSRLGILGTQNRRCNSTTLAIDSCSILCCGRGYQVMIEELEEDCNCSFVWCCKVKCDRCKRQMTVNICN